MGINYIHHERRIAYGTAPHSPLRVVAAHPVDLHPRADDEVDRPRGHEEEDVAHDVARCRYPVIIKGQDKVSLCANNLETK